MKTRISKHFSAGRHDGWKKTVAGREWFLGYGTSAIDEANSSKLAAGLEAKWQLVKLSGGTELSDSDYEDIKGLVLGLAAPAQESPHAPITPLAALPVLVSVTNATPSPSVAVAPPGLNGPRKWLYESIDIYSGTLRRRIKPDDSNADHILNTCFRISRALSGIADLPLDALRRKELDDWLAFFRARPPSLSTGKPIGVVTIRNISQEIRAFLKQCIEWEWWIAPPLWERAFKDFSIKKLSTDAEKREQRKRPQTHNLTEKRVLWHFATPFQRAMMGLADWAGHTQKEIATLRFEEVLDVGGEMYIDRHRYKTGVQGRWWIPPEPARAIQAQMAKTPRDAQLNPTGLAFLSPYNRPLVHRAITGKKARSDYVAQEWSALLRWTHSHGVRPISFKYMRKGTSQLVRDRTHREMSQVFCAQTLDDVQDQSYSRPSYDQLERCIRGIHEEVKFIYVRISPIEMEQAISDVYRSRGIGREEVPQSAA
jgi:hypothetical protein